VRYNNGNRIDCSCGAVFARWRGLGILSLARVGLVEEDRRVMLENQAVLKSEDLNARHKVKWLRLKECGGKIDAT